MTANTMHPDRARSVLGVRPNASGAEIERAYRRLAQAHHPDRHTARFAEIQQARDALADVVRAAEAAPASDDPWRKTFELCEEREAAVRRGLELLREAATAFNEAIELGPEALKSAPQFLDHSTRSIRDRNQDDSLERAACGTFCGLLRGDRVSGPGLTHIAAEETRRILWCRENPQAKE